MGNPTNAQINGALYKEKYKRKTGLEGYADGIMGGEVSDGNVCAWLGLSRIKNMGIGMSESVKSDPTGFSFGYSMLKGLIWDCSVYGIYSRSTSAKTSYEQGYVWGDVTYSLATTVAPVAAESNALKGTVHLQKFKTSSIRISQTLESNAEMAYLRNMRKSIEAEGINYDIPFKDQIHIFQYEGTNYLVNGHNRFAVAQKLGINQINAYVIGEDYLMSRYQVTPTQLVGRSNTANRIGNRLRW